MKRRNYHHIRSIRQDLRDILRWERIERTHRTWGKDVLINDAPGEEFCLNSLLIFQADNSSQIVENENRSIVPPNDAQNELITQNELSDQGTRLSNFRYPSISHS